MTDKLEITSRLVWIGILVLTGTYFRVRTADSVPETDWLVIAQVMASLLGGVLGVLLIRKWGAWGIGAKALIGYLFAAALSALFSRFPGTVMGYWILLWGSSLLTIGLVYRARSPEALEGIEMTWFVVAALLLSKDTLIGILFPDVAGTQDEDELFRLGIGLTHANEMGLFASLGFWISFAKGETTRPIVRWMFRILFLGVMLLTRARISIISFIIAGVAFFWFKYGFRQKEGFYLRIFTFCLLSMMICFGILALSLQWTWVTGPFDYLNRYQDLDEMMSLTGRSEIWLHALSRVVEGWIPLILGHGYGVSRFVINEGHQVPSFFASHAHNALIEVVLTTGILGLIPFVTMVAYSGRWLTRFRELGERYSHHFVLRAICTTLIIWVSSLTESHLGMKIGPIAMIYFFYVVALDRRKDFELSDVVSSQGERTGGGNVQELCPRDGSPKRGKKHHGNDTLGGRADAFTREMGHRERRFG